jgi:plastocyanin
VARRPRVARSLCAVAALALGALVAACTGTAAAPSPVATTSVDLPKSYRFAPADIVVARGATVTWANNDAFTHNVTFDGGEALRLAPGEQASRTFEDAGRFEYVCSLHPRDMTGSVTVTSP